MPLIWPALSPSEARAVQAALRGFELGLVTRDEAEKAIEAAAQASCERLKR